MLTPHLLPQRLVVDLINNNQIGVGPWYTAPDEFLVSGEALVRNLLYGIMQLEELNASYTRIGYVPDQFGHTSQLPQIFHGFDLLAAATMRGTPLNVAVNNFWESPDGTRILLMVFRNYCGMHFNEGEGDLVARINQKAADSEHDQVQTLYSMNGCDHRDLDHEAGLAVRRAQAEIEHGRWLLPASAPGVKQRQVVGAYHSNLEDVARLILDEIEEKHIQLPTLKGELREGIDHLADVTSSGMSLKRRNWQAQELLESWAEPINVAATAAVRLPCAP
jgi:hypothetical protein